MFISPELILSQEFHNDVIKAESFRHRLRLFAIDELHCVENWKDFRPMYSKLGVLRSRLRAVPYLGVTATLSPRLEQVVRAAGGFDYSCPIVRTSIDRPEIAIHVLFAEGRVTLFEDLRRFFPLECPDYRPIRRAQDIPKTVFYFRTIKKLMAFVATVRRSWMPEFGYPPQSGNWIQMYFAPMADIDKLRITEEFKDPSSNIRFLAASEGFGMGQHIEDIVTIVNDGLPDTLASLAQRLGRAMRNGQPGGRFFLVADPYASIAPLASKPARRQKRDKPSAHQHPQSAGSSDSDASLQVPRGKRDTHDAARRAKLESDLVDFINAPVCHRLTLLKNLGI